MVWVMTWRFWWILLDLLRFSGTYQVLMETKMKRWPLTPPTDRPRPLQRQTSQISWRIKKCSNQWAHSQQEAGPDRTELRQAGIRTATLWLQTRGKGTIQSAGGPAPTQTDQSATTKQDPISVRRFFQIAESFKAERTAGGAPAPSCSASRN